MEYGLKGSTDVLIINGTTGQRCRRPKADFWLSADVTPILFKFPTDQEFDAYLKEKCQFGIPEMEEVTMAEEVDSKSIAQEIWKRCDGQNMKSCWDSEIAGLEGKDLKSRVAFDLRLIYQREKPATTEISTTAPVVVVGPPVIKVPPPAVAPKIESGDEEKVFTDSKLALESLATRKALACVAIYPMDTALNRVKFKLQRQSCLLDAWDALENEAISRSLVAPVTSVKIKNRLAPLARPLQIKIIKAHF